MAEQQDSKKPAEQTDAPSTEASKQPAAAADEIKKLKILYLSFAASSILMFTPLQPIPLIASLAMLLILLACYLPVKFGNETAFSAHYKWLIRTFWIGMGLFLPLVTILALGIILKYGDKTAFAMIEQASDAATIPNDLGLKQFMQDNGMMALTIVGISWGGFGAWWFTRLWRGFKGLQSGASFKFKNVMTWWV